MSRQISAFYKNKNILLTGGTGFLGQTCVEKLLRSFPDIGNIYMIARSKKGAALEQRKEQYLNHPIFNRIKSENQSVLSKLKWIEGELSLDNLGLTPTMIKYLQQSVNLIIHSAAAMNFSCPLKKAIDHNVRATGDLLNFASGCKTLNCFMYVSTAYSQARKSRHHITEDVLEHPIDPKDLIQIGKTHTIEELNAKTKDLIFDWTTNYMYSKNAAENLCLEYSDQFPIAIYRPGIVLHSHKEPLPYWIGNSTGFGRGLIEANRGFVIVCNPDCNSNCVPVDITINGALAALYHTAKDNKLNVFNCTTNNHPISFSKAFEYYRNSIPEYANVLVPHRYKLLSMKNFVPGSVEERMQTEMLKFKEFCEECQYFLWNELTYSNDNLEHLWSQMNDEDKELLPFDVRAMDWKEYYSNMHQKAFGIPKVKFEDL